MSLLKRLKKKVAKAINKVAEKVSNTIEEAGNNISDAANDLGDTVARNVPIIGPAVGTAVRWMGRVSSGICDLAATAVKGAGAVLTGVTDLIIGGIGGLITGDWGLVKESLIGFIENTIGGILILGGGFISLIQTIFGAQHRKTKLNKTEINILRLVFRESLDTKNICIIKGRSGSGVYRFTDRPFTMGNIIYMKDTDPADWNKTLVHEGVHVWQYQHTGSRYSADALGAQFILGKDRSYQWWKEPTPWTEFNAEAQGKFFEHMYEGGELQQPNGSWARGDGCFFRGDAMTLNQFRFSDFEEDPWVGNADHPLQEYTQLGNETTDYVRNQPSER